MSEMRLTKWCWLRVLGLLLVLLTACGAPAGDGTPTDQPPASPMHGLADVYDIEIQIMESFPVQVTVVAKGNLPDGCTEVDEIRQEFHPESNTFAVEITTVHPTDADCTEAEVPFEERISLDVYGLSAGVYTVDVNGVSDTFTLEVDNVPQEPPVEEVSWEEARELILAGEVEQVFQLHSLEVTLYLYDGRKLVTTEPHIDDVFEVVEECGEPCADMMLATE